MLEVSDLSVRYGSVIALEGLDLRVDPGEIVVLIGANGAGKSSAVNALGGLMRPARGSIRFAGVDVGRLNAIQRIRLGLAMVIEGRGVFSEMSVRENMELGAYAKPNLRSARLREAVDQAVAMFPRLGDRMSQAAGSLSGGEQQMLAIARALISSPRLLLLDEPSLGLAPKIVDEIAERLVELSRKSAVTILIAEQNAVLGLDIAGRGYVLQRGRKVLEGTAAELKSRKDMIELYLNS